LWQPAGRELLRGEGYFRGPVEVLPQYGLDVDEHQPGIEPTLRAKLGLQDSIVVGYVGRLVPEKGLRILLDALDQLRSLPWKLLLVGAGRSKTKSERSDGQASGANRALAGRAL